MRIGTRMAGCETPQIWAPPGVSPPAREQRDMGVWVRITEEGFQAEPLLLADPDAGVGERVIENLGKG